MHILLLFERSLLLFAPLQDYIEDYIERSLLPFAPLANANIFYFKCKLQYHTSLHNCNFSSFGENFRTFSSICWSTIFFGTFSIENDSGAKFGSSVEVLLTSSCRANEASVDTNSDTREMFFFFFSGETTVLSCGSDVADVISRGTDVDEETQPDDSDF